MPHYEHDYRRDHKAERERLFSDNVFLDEVDALFDTVVSESPELQVAIDERRSMATELRKEWVKNNQEQLKEYRQRLYGKVDKGKCIDCGADILSISLRCKRCNMKIIGESRGRKRGEETTNINREEKTDDRKQQMQEAIPGVSVRNERDVPHVPIFRQEEGEQK